MIKKAVCLFSGGLDSTTVLYKAIRDGYVMTALTVNYGQVHSREIESARSIASRCGVRHHVLYIDLPWKGSSLLGDAAGIPAPAGGIVDPSEIPSTYVPARNTIFLSLASSLAEVSGAEAIFIGANAVDYSGYPDCRPQFLDAFAACVRLGTQAGVTGRTIRIESPLVHMSKKDIVVMAKNLGVPLEMTWSCYRGGAKPCGRCDSCALRRKGFEEAGITDPVIYEIRSER